MDRRPNLRHEGEMTHARVNRVEYLDVDVPYWLKEKGGAFERAWASDRRAELEEILADAYRSGYMAGQEGGPRDD